MGFRNWALATLAGAVVASASLAMPGAAHAQQDQPLATGASLMDEAEWEEFSCIYSELMVLEDDEYFDVVDAYILESTEGELYERALDALMPAVEFCSEEHVWSADEQEIAMTMGIAGTVADALEGELLASGLSEEELDEVIALVDEMSDDDLYMFIAEDWRRDEDFMDRMAIELIARGAPDDEDGIAQAIVLIEAYLIGMFQAERWLDVRDS